MRRRWWPYAIAAGVTLNSVIGWFWHRSWREHRHDRFILAAAQRHHVDPALVKALIWQESRFDERARGSAQEIGLMQIREPAAQEWAKAEKVRAFHPILLLNPAANTQAGTWYLAKMLKRYARTDRPVVYALADYNAGRSNVRRWLQGAAATNSAAFLAAMDFPGTRKYISNIVARTEVYRPEFRSGTLPEDAAAGSP